MKSFYYKTLLKRQLSKKELVKVDDRHNDVDKESLLIDLAQKMDYGIVVGTQLQANKKKKKGLRVYRLAKNFTVDFKSNMDMVLIDESVDPSLIEIIREKHLNIEIVGGFIKS